MSDCNIWDFQGSVDSCCFPVYFDSCVIWYMGTNFSVELATFIFRISLFWGEDILLNLPTTGLHDVITQSPQYKMSLSV